MSINLGEGNRLYYYRSDKRSELLRIASYSNGEIKKSPLLTYLIPFSCFHARVNIGFHDSHTTHPGIY